MPGLDGLAAAHRLREMGAGATIVFLTIHESPELVEACFGGGSTWICIEIKHENLIPAINVASSGLCFVSTRHTHS
jgi:DNA-binding NarL/FixJ family response regulator